ncbi:VWA domain-containing protein [Acidicapsa acidisoli]|uniref:VWA domain-containing protein n=1 Tax=Acidicapsa acidisoli TaxID=1615681 RepID=UPI0021DF7142|nr:VWA domain-containing protein [Acidicapsa acidisoli]
MMKASLPLAFFTILIAGSTSMDAQSGATAISSQPSKLGSSGPYTLHVNAEEVVLNCTVLNDKGELVNDLTKNNFKVFEDKTIQTIISLQHLDTPVSIGLLIDDSGSMSSKRTAVSSAALDLVKASNPQDETFVINFSDQAYLDQDFTSDLDELQNGLSHLSLSGGTALYDTVVTAADKMERSATRPRKVLIVITDGDDNSSKLTLDDAIHRVRDMQGPIIYSIGLLFGGDRSRHARHDLQALSSETGGIAFFPGSLKDVDSVAAEVARDIRNQYAIAYHSVRASAGGYHSVKVEARAQAQGRLTVYTRSGYLSKPSSSRGPMADEK